MVCGKRSVIKLHLPPRRLQIATASAMLLSEVAPMMMWHLASNMSQPRTKVKVAGAVYVSLEELGKFTKQVMPLWSCEKGETGAEDESAQEQEAHKKSIEDQCGTFDELRRNLSNTISHTGLAFVFNRPGKEDHVDTAGALEGYVEWLEHEMDFRMSSLVSSFHKKTEAVITPAAMDEAADEETSDEVQAKSNKKRRTNKTNTKRRKTIKRGHQEEY